MEALSTQFNKVVGAAQQAVAGVTERVSGVKNAGVSRINSLREFATGTISSLKAKGLKTWSVEVSKAIRIAAAAQMQMVNAKTTQVMDTTKSKAQDAAVATKDLVSQKSFQATAGGAAGGAVAMGAGAGATGLAAGGVVGAAAGLPLALFTFGLSIPVGAVIGAGSGLVIGAGVGVTAGGVAGGAAGYGAYQKKDEIAGAAKYVAGKAQEGADRVKGAAQSSVESVKGAAESSLEKAKGVATATKARISNARNPNGANGKD